MANCGKDILLAREGTEQNQRYLKSLDPGWVKLNDFGLEEWMRFAWNFAKHLNYFGTDNDKVPLGNWQDFFISKDDLKDFLSEVEKSSEITPHLALFVTFIKLLDYTQKHFNQLTQRHLDFYYHEVLKLEKQEPTPDKVYVLFELAKNVLSAPLEKGTQLDGGKDSSGKKMIYSTTEELVANQTKVALLKNIYNDHDNEKIKAAEVANSFDGKGEDFPDKQSRWWAFGYYQKPPLKGESDQREFPELDNARLGFAIAGEILELQEGHRNIQISLSFDTNLAKNYSVGELNSALEVYCSGEKGWLGHFDLVENVKDNDGKIALASGFPDGNLKKLNLVFSIPKDEKSLANYNSKTHGENYTTSFPVCRVLLKTGAKEGYELYRDLITKQVKEIQVDILVTGVNSLKLSNDIGDINVAKPFYPFGTQPVKKSKFYIDYPELYKKKWNDLSVSILWKNTPDDFRAWYAAYRNTFKAQISATDYLQGILTDDYLKSIVEAVTTRSIQKGDLPNRKTAEKDIFKYDNLIISGNSDFKATAEILQNEDWGPVSGKTNLPMFDTKEDDGSFSMNFDIENLAKGTDESGPLRLSLNQTFLHEMYPRLYALAMSSEDKNVLIPNEPYTPFVETITLNYTASAKIKPEGKTYKVRDFDFYHEHPFGQAEENIEIKLANKIVEEQEAKSLRAVPSYCRGGEFYIGLEKAQQQQIVSLLIQVLEGSENPEADSFVGKQKVEWWMLCRNDWKQLDTQDILLNETDNLLKSGIFRFTVPKEASNDNTLLPGGYFWLKARIHKNYDAVSKTIGVHAQAVTAMFSNKGNSLSQLANGLAAGTISKMINRKPLVKGLSQPYNSFGGREQESDAAFYRRISERLRHKNRAITLWDYEHLLLQNFPEIHKVKCLNHTSSVIENNKRKTRYLAPGNVVLVVIPDIVNRNVFDIYKPRVSRATLNRIEDFFHNLNSSLVKIRAINPEYEEVRVVLKVQFNRGFDEVHYKTVLKSDLTRLLSPWAFDNTASINFGLSLHKSIVVNFIEKLNYIDFVSDLKLFQTNAATDLEKEVNIAIPSSPEAILVSSKAHVVGDYENLCTKTDIEPAESCQK